jgi:hypothetical protein
MARVTAGVNRRFVVQELVPAAPRGITLSAVYRGQGIQLTEVARWRASITTCLLGSRAAAQSASIWRADSLASLPCRNVFLWDKVAALRYTKKIAGVCMLLMGQTHSRPKIKVAVRLYPIDGGEA